MLTRDQLQGLWVSVLNPWDEGGGFDEKSFRDEIAMLLDAHPHGLYTTGSTGEFYALDWDEFTRLVDTFVAEAAGKIPIQVGANWFNTRDTIRRTRYARDRGVDGVQICFPPWMEMRVEDNDQFLEDVYRAVPDIALIHYNVGRARRIFHGRDYARVCPRVPSLIGTKVAGMPMHDVVELVLNAPDLNHFVGELLFGLAHQVGASGMYTSLFMMNPDFFHDYYRLCVEGRYAEAVRLSMRLAGWFDVAVRPLIEKGYMDPSLDKAFVEIGGWLPVHRRTRRPYPPVTETEMAELRRATHELMPELVSYKP